MSTDAPDGDPADFAAGEYVLGTLPLEERLAFARRLDGDAGLRAAVQTWERRLAALNGSTPEETPPRSLWERIARTLPHRADAEARVVALRRQVRRWRAATAAVGLVAAGLGAFAVLAPRPGADVAGRTIAVVTSGGALPALIVSVDARTGTVHVRPVDAPTPAGRSLALWYVGADAAPEPLGVVAERTRLTLPAEARDGVAAGVGAFAVSVEPPGGSPTGQPTGPVIYSGRLIPE